MLLSHTCICSSSSVSNASKNSSCSGLNGLLDPVQSWRPAGYPALGSGKSSVSIRVICSSSSSRRRSSSSRCPYHKLPDCLSIYNATEVSSCCHISIVSQCDSALRTHRQSARVVSVFLGVLVKLYLAAQIQTYPSCAGTKAAPPMAIGFCLFLNKLTRTGKHTNAKGKHTNAKGGWTITACTDVRFQIMHDVWSTTENACGAISDYSSCK